MAGFEVTINGRFWVTAEAKERKYVLTGTGVGGQPVGVVLKTGSGGKAVVITVYREKAEEL